MLGGMRQMPEYGIQNERSHTRAHVCPRVQRVYIYPTENARKLIEGGNLTRKSATQPGVNGKTTGRGYVVKPDQISGCVCIQLPSRTWQHVDIRREQSTSEKGRRAVRLVMGMVKHRMIPMPASADEIQDYDLQVSGADVIVDHPAGRYVVQVKCDYNGGPREYGGTGNLFLQTWEINPLKRH